MCSSSTFGQSEHNRFIGYQADKEKHKYQGYNHELTLSARTSFPTDGRTLPRGMTSSMPECTKGTTKGGRSQAATSFPTPFRMAPICPRPCTLYRVFGSHKSSYKCLVELHWTLSFTITNGESLTQPHAPETACLLGRCAPIVLPAVSFQQPAFQAVSCPPLAAQAGPWPRGKAARGRHT